MQTNWPEFLIAHEAAEKAVSRLVSHAARVDSCWKNPCSAAACRKAS